MAALIMERVNQGKKKSSALNIQIEAMKRQIATLSKESEVLEADITEFQLQRKESETRYHNAVLSCENLSAEIRAMEKEYKEMQEMPIVSTTPTKVRIESVTKKKGVAANKENSPKLTTERKKQLLSKLPKRKKETGESPKRKNAQSAEKNKNRKSTSAAR
eukprot:m.343205 g.343205  ORF g.343205 m.343205 type:complete len:161 (+) comp22475_c0_seq1:198-680(+)